MITVALPLYTSVSTAWFMRWMEMDKTPVTNFLATRKLYLERSMTEMFQGSLQYDHTWLVVYEGDMMPPRDAFTRIAQYPDHLDIVGSVYFQHQSPHDAIVYEEAQPGLYRAMSHDRMRQMMDAPGMYPVDAVGFGLTAIHRRVIEKWDGEDFFGVPGLGHDMAFCKLAKTQGFQVHVDSGLECGHLSELAVKPSAVLAARKEK